MTGVANGNCAMIGFASAHAFASAKLAKVCGSNEKEPLPGPTDAFPGTP